MEKRGKYARPEPVRMPSLKSIPRAVPNTPSKNDPHVATLGKLALVTLGYSPLFEETSTSTTLDRVLETLEIEVLDTDAVNKYKKERLTFLNSTVEELTSTDEDEEEADGEVDEDDEEEAPRTRGRYRWQSSTLKHYSKPIPEFVLAKAIQIKQELPKAQLRVDYVRFDKDPFLAVSFGGQLRYVEVWDEPKFEGRMTAEDVKRLRLA